jgi:hypothetical protein
MVASISLSGTECRHADEIFAFPARTEFSVTTAQGNVVVDDFSGFSPDLGARMAVFLGLGTYGVVYPYLMQCPD